MDNVCNRCLFSIPSKVEMAELPKNKNIYEVPNWVYFGQREDFKLTTELSEKVKYCRNQAIKNGLNEAILLMSINEALLSRQNFVPFK